MSYDMTASSGQMDAKMTMTGGNAKSDGRQDEHEHVGQTHRCMLATAGSAALAAGA